MEGYEASTYGDHLADIYDDIYRFDNEVAFAVALLSELAGEGPALELAIGTGRIAVPLAAIGVPVEGIEISTAMVERLRQKAGDEQIKVVIGDIADVPVEGTYPLIYIVFNTLFALTTQEEQVRCFANVAEHLSDDGVFLVEAFVPDIGRFRNGQTTTVSQVELDHVLLDVSRHDPSTQTVVSQHVRLTPGDVRLDPVVIRYAWPAEIDLMAQLAGLQLRHRWAGWDRRPFGPSSQQHISVYELASQP